MSEPLSRLPSLDLLKGFVAVGRRMSITLAARDLCLTQSAVSRQVRALEESLGRTLLLRRHRAVAFTPEGERLFREADHMLRQLQQTVAGLRDRRRPVGINASIGVTSLWLLPRLGAFQQQHPDIEVRVTALNRLVDLDREASDLTIRYCPSAAAPAQALRLFDETVAPVAHPALGLAALERPDDLAGQVLLEYDDPGHPWLQWDTWLERRGWSGLKPRAVLRFNQYDQAVLAALAGQGVALGRLPLLGRQLADGQLRRLATPQATATDHAYWLIRGDGGRRPEADAVADWIEAEAAREAP